MNNWFEEVQGISLIMTGRSFHFAAAEVPYG
jgi:hypothetical protein